MSQENKTVPSFLRFGSSLSKRCPHRSPWCLGSVYNSLASTWAFTTGTGSRGVKDKLTLSPPGEQGLGAPEIVRGDTTRLGQASTRFHLSLTQPRCTC